MCSVLHCAMQSCYCIMPRQCACMSWYSDSALSFQVDNVLFNKRAYLLLPIPEKGCHFSLCTIILLVHSVLPYICDEVKWFHLWMEILTFYCRYFTWLIPLTSGSNEGFVLHVVNGFENSTLCKPRSEGGNAVMSIESLCFPRFCISSTSAAGQTLLWGVHVRMAMGRVEQYYTHTRIVDGYIILHIPVPMGVNLCPYPYPAGTHTHWVPNGWIKYYTRYSLFYFHR
jgi:hypothetical protein